MRLLLSSAELDLQSRHSPGLSHVKGKPPTGYNPKGIESLIWNCLLFLELPKLTMMLETLSRHSPSLLAKRSSTVVRFGASVEVKGTVPDLGDD